VSPEYVSTRPRIKMGKTSANAVSRDWGFWWMSGLIVLAGLAAFDRSILSCFYLDDGWQIEDSPWVEGGEWYRWTFRSIPFLIHWLTWKAFGMSAPAFHAGNLLLHLFNGVLLRSFLEKLFVDEDRDAARLFSLWSALLFVVHPLASEITNYVRTRDIEMVLTFSLIAGLGAVVFAQGKARVSGLGGVVVGVIGATFSKEIGVVCAIATSATGFYVIFSGKDVGMRMKIRTRPMGFLLAFLLLGVAILFFFTPAFKWGLGFVSDSRIWFHCLTQARVFWHYTWLFFAPFHLCSDHLVAWTISWRDIGAWMAVVGLVAVLAGVVFLSARKLCLEACLVGGALFPILLYFPLVSSELMVEYRVYPALPFACAVAVLLGFRLTDYFGFPRRHFAIQATLAVLCVVLIGFSRSRTADWRNHQALTASILREYPLQARAVTGLAWYYAEHGEPREVLALHDEASRILDGVIQWNKETPYRRLDPGHYVMSRLDNESVYALALALNGSPRAGEAQMSWLRERLVTMKMDEPFLWNDFFYTRGRIRESSGDIVAAIADYQTALGYAARGFSYGQEPYLYSQQKALDRLLKKQAAMGKRD